MRTSHTRRQRRLGQPTRIVSLICDRDRCSARRQPRTFRTRAIAAKPPVHDHPRNVIDRRRTADPMTCVPPAHADRSMRGTGAAACGRSDTSGATSEIVWVTQCASRPERRRRVRAEKRRARALAPKTVPVRVPVLPRNRVGPCRAVPPSASSVLSDPLGNTHILALAVYDLSLSRRGSE
jgi:hypothetical protein